ncbi:MAG TPA: PilZ domain-containing protein [Polyangia bacterium]|nr:PilZ domain-containing protein [Polyangia bacterium]
MDDRVQEFLDLTEKCNLGEASADEYIRWCELRQELRRSDLTARRMKERRFLRTPIDLPVTVRLGEVTHEARCIEFSAGGMKLALPHVLDQGARLRLRFRFPGDQETWRVNCKVVWSDRHRRRFGVEFEGLSDEQIEELRAVVLTEHLLRQRSGTD